MSSKHKNIVVGAYKQTEACPQRPKLFIFMFAYVNKEKVINFKNIKQVVLFSIGISSFQSKKEIQDLKLTLLHSKNGQTKIEFWPFLVQYCQ